MRSCVAPAPRDPRRRDGRHAGLGRSPRRAPQRRLEPAHQRAGLRRSGPPGRRRGHHRRGHPHPARVTPRNEDGVSLHPRGVLAVAGTCFVALAATVVTLGAIPADTACATRCWRWRRPAVVEAMRVVNRAGDWRVLAPGMLVMFVVFPEARRQWWLWSGADGDRAAHGMGAQAPGAARASGGSVVGLPQRALDGRGGVLGRGDLSGRRAVAAAVPRVRARAGRDDDRARRHRAGGPARALALRCARLASRSVWRWPRSPG